MENGNNYAFNIDANYRTIKYSMSQQSLAMHALEWLSTNNNSNFINWSLFSNGTNKDLYLSKPTDKNLEENINISSARELILIIKSLTQIVEQINNSILLIENICMDKNYIFISKNKNDLYLKMIYIPQNSKIMNRDDFLIKYQNILSEITNKLIKLDKNSKHKDSQQKFILRMQNNQLELSNELDNMLKDYNIKGNAVSINTFNLLYSRIVKYKNLINLPNLLLLTIILLIFILYCLEIIIENPKKEFLFIIVGLIGFIMIIELIILFYPTSPYKLKFNNPASKFIKTNINDDTTTGKIYSTNVNLHSINNNRFAELKLLSGSVNNKNNWNILNSDFTIGGTMDRCDLFIEYFYPEDIICRIFQRSGTFFIESMSNEIIVKLSGRTIYKFQEYELSNNCKIQVDNFTFQLNIF